VNSLPDLQAKIKTARGRFQQRPESRDFAPLADLLREAGQYREALLLLDKGLRKFPHYVTGHVIKGRTLNEAGYGQLGQGALKKALELDPQNILALDLLIGEATARKAWKEVLGPLEKLVALEPEDEKLGVFLTRVRGKLQDEDQRPDVPEDYHQVKAEVIPSPEVKKLPHVAAEEEPIPEPEPEAIPEPEKTISDVPEKTEATVSNPQPGPSHVTMTMVDIYLAQGYREMAITALEEILVANPGREDVLTKLAGLRDDPNCGVPESRKESPTAGRPSVGKQAMAEQRRRDKDQFTQWIEGVTESRNENPSGDTP
jgi:tetratricopeptide (TPR) repeat protein